MESLAALSLAGTVVQFVEFATKIAKGTHEIFESTQGMITVHEQLKGLTNNLQEMCDELQKPIPEEQLTRPAEKRLKGLAGACAEECKYLQDGLNDLRVQEGSNVWESLVAAIKANNKEKTIVKIQERLDRFGTVIGIQLGEILK